MTVIPKEIELKFTDEKTAREWFEAERWPDGRYCGKCGSTSTVETKNGLPMPYWCSDCRGYFSVRTGTFMQNSNTVLQQWANAVWILKDAADGMTGTRLAFYLRVSPTTARHMKKVIMYHNGFVRDIYKRLLQK